MDIPQDTKFETAMARLEQIVRALQSGEAPLDASLALFEEGVALVKHCNQQLDSAEQKVKILTGSGDELTEIDFRPNEAQSPSAASAEKEHSGQ